MDRQDRQDFEHNRQEFIFPILIILFIDVIKVSNMDRQGFIFLS